MKKIIGILLAIITVVGCVFAFVGCSDNKEALQVYTEAGFAPFEYIKDNQVVGVDIDVMNYIGKELGYKVVINDIDFDNILKEVEGNKLAVGAAGMSQKAERDEVAKASIVYATSTQYIIAPNGTFAEDAVVSFDDLFAKATKIGVQKGTTGQSLVNGKIKEGSANSTIEYRNAIIASQDIGSTLQAVVIDELPAKSIASDNSNLSCWKIDTAPESYVFYFNKEAGELVEKVNAILEKMIADGTIDQYIVNHSNKD